MCVIDRFRNRENVSFLLIGAKGSQLQLKVHVYVGLTLARATSIPTTSPGGELAAAFVTDHLRLVATNLANTNPSSKRPDSPDSPQDQLTG